MAASANPAAHPKQATPTPHRFGERAVAIVVGTSGSKTGLELSDPIAALA
jgi:hypothetical protein